MNPPVRISVHNFFQAGVLQYAKQITDAHAGVPIVDAVITVPAWFGIAQRQVSTRAAAYAPGR
jgi:hypoxia up-regulated 1